MATLQELRETQAQIDGELRQLASDRLERRNKGGDNAGPDWTDTETQRFADLRERRRANKEALESEQRNDDLVKWLEESNKNANRNPGRETLNDAIPGDRERRSYGDVFDDKDHAREYAKGERRRALAMQAWGLRAHNLPLTEEHRHACQALAFDPDSTQIRVQPFETDDLQRLQRASRSSLGESRRAAIERVLESRAAINSTDNAAIIPTTYVREFNEAMITTGGVIGAADLLVTATGERMTWPTGDDTANEGAQVDEVTAQNTDSVNPNFANFYVQSYEFSSKFIRVGNPTLRDNAINLAVVLGQMGGRRLGRIINRKATTGNRTGTLGGIATRSRAGVTMASASTWTWQELRRLVHSVDEAHRREGSFMLSDDVLLQFLLLTDGDGKPLLTEPNGDVPGRLMNKPYHVNNYMPTAAELAAAVTATAGILFGDMKAYKLRMVGDVRTERLRERFAEFDQTAFISYQGADGDLMLAGTAASDPVRSLATPAA